VKKTTAILFFFFYLFSTTEIYQLLKMPVVFQHFREHQQENKSISFLVFLDMHYMHGSPMDDDYERDMQLPFKTSENYFSSVSPAFIPEYNQILLSKPVEITDTKKIVSQNLFLLSPYLSAIWQPPKNC
jgi:hypothetical protein